VTETKRYEADIHVNAWGKITGSDYTIRFDAPADWTPSAVENRAKHMAQRGTVHSVEVRAIREIK
jgi:hypothetical protein